jgi:hypothetical protein
MGGKPSKHFLLGATAEITETVGVGQEEEGTSIPRPELPASAPPVGQGGASIPDGGVLVKALVPPDIGGLGGGGLGRGGLGAGGLGAGGEERAGLSGTGGGETLGVTSSARTASGDA